MSNTQPDHPMGTKKIFQSSTIKIGMTATLGVGAIAVLVTCLVIFSSSSTTTAEITNVEKLLIDTDAGADDAIAILVALESERVNRGTKIVGITCVNGNTYVDNVALNVLKTLNVVDRLDIPVYKGANQPLLINDEKTIYFGEDGFGDFDYPDPPSIDLLQKNHAVNAMIDLVKENPGEVTLLCLGPLTNVALAIRMYPSFLNDLQQLIILGGSSEGVGNVRPGIEFNFSIDPAANYIVLNARTSKRAILVPYETTLRAKSKMAFRTSLTEIYNRKTWLINSAESISLNAEDEFWECADAVATVIALTSGGIATSSKNVYLDAIHEGVNTAGMILIDSTNITQKTPNTNLIENIDVEEYQRMLSTLLS